MFNIIFNDEMNTSQLYLLLQSTAPQVYHFSSQINTHSEALGQRTIQTVLNNEKHLIFQLFPMHGKNS